MTDRPPTYPPPDAASGETCPFDVRDIAPDLWDLYCRFKPWHHAAYIAGDDEQAAGMFRDVTKAFEQVEEAIAYVRSQPPAPPSAPASEGNAEFEHWWLHEHILTVSMSEERIARDAWHAATEAAERQHAAEVADAEKFRAQLTEKLVRRGFQVGELQAALKAAQQEAAQLRGWIREYRDAWAALDAGTETVDVKQAQVDHMHRSRAALFAALAATPPAPACPGYGYAHSTGISCAVCAPEEAALPAEQEATGRMVLKSVSANIGGGTAATAAEYARYMRRQQTAVDQPPPADADALRERVLADWADCPHCHHWGHQHRYGVCMVCDKRDQTCGLFALTPPPANADADALREAARYRAALGQFVNRYSPCETHLTVPRCHWCGATLGQAHRPTCLWQQGLDVLAATPPAAPTEGQEQRWVNTRGAGLRHLSDSTQPPPAEQEGPAYRLVARIERPPLTLPADDCHAMGHDEPPPADADASARRIVTEEIAALESLVIGMLHADEDAFELAKAYVAAIEKGDAHA